MKNLIIIICVFLTANVYAQSLEVNGLHIGGKYTEKQIFEALGQQPTKIRGPQPMDEEQNTYIFYFGEDRVEWVDGCVYDIHLQTNRYAFNGIIRVGDPVSKLEQLKGYIRTYDDAILWQPSKNPAEYEGSETWFFHDNGTITIINTGINEL